MCNDREIDRVILSLVTSRWQKTAKIIAVSVDEIEPSHPDSFANKVAKRIEYLVVAKQLESQGDLSRWRHSEIRLSTS